MGTLGGLAEMAERLLSAGFNAYCYRGAHKQSIEMAMELSGAYRFPENSSITAVESAAKASRPTQPYWPDAVLFGKWRG